MTAARSVTCILSITVRVDDAVLDQRLASSPHVIGGELARHIHDYALREDLGYYPALAYFAGLGEHDTDLLSAQEGIVWFVTHWVRDEVRRHLRPAFSQVEFLAMQSLAYTMPKVRPGMPNALYELTRHLTANAIKLSLKLTGPIEHEHSHPVESRVEQRVRQCLLHHFDDLEIGRCEYLPEQA